MSLHTDWWKVTPARNLMKMSWRQKYKTRKCTYSVVEHKVNQTHLIKVRVWVSWEWSAGKFRKLPCQPKSLILHDLSEPDTKCQGCPQQVGPWRRKFFGPPARADWLKLYTKSERMTFGCSVTCAGCERVNPHNWQKVILLRKTKTCAT